MWRLFRTFRRDHPGGAGIACALSLLCLGGCSYVARAHCMEVYCASTPEGEKCPHEDDLVIICTEDRLKDYKSVAGWFGVATLDALRAMK